MYALSLKAQGVLKSLKFMLELGTDLVSWNLLDCERLLPS
jgi:hypothetical protein